jgi:NAD(P)-dependent dehydrogenase (short-subunit alcohol dehydrogenase family)
LTANRVAVVTGGTRGIGLACAEALTAAGCRVAVGARSAADPTIDAAARAAVGERGLVAALDVRDPASVAAFVAETDRALGPIDILVNAAGVTVHSFVRDHDEAAWTDVVDINLNGPFRMIRAVLGGMMTRGWGRIVNIASTAARTATDDHAAYCASKTGLIGLTRAVALEGAPKGVTCVAVSPTWVETEMLRASAATMAANTGRTADAVIAEMSAASPQGRLVQPAEIAALVAFCCSDAAAGLTMEDIQVNAGALW